MLRYGTIILICALFLVLVAGASAQSQHYTLNGDFAKAYFNVGFATNDVYVSRTNSGSTYMSFNLYYAPNYVVSGYGSIPNTAFKGTPGTGYTLDVDITDLQAQVMACDTTDFNVYNCWPVTVAGRLQIHWDKTNQEMDSYTYTYRFHMPGRRVMERGSEDSTSAVSSGSMLGTAVWNGVGWIGKTHNTNVDIQIGKK